MQIVTNETEPGTNVKLNPVHADKQFYEKLDDGKELHLIANRVVRVDKPSARMWQSLDKRVAHYNAETDQTEPLLVETDEPANYVPTSSVNNSFPTINTNNNTASPKLLEQQNREFARGYGLTIDEALVEDGEATDLATKRRSVGKVAVSSRT